MPRLAALRMGLPAPAAVRLAAARARQWSTLRSSLRTLTSATSTQSRMATPGSASRANTSASRLRRELSSRRLPSTRSGTRPDAPRRAMEPRATWTATSSTTAHTQARAQASRLAPVPVPARTRRARQAPAATTAARGSLTVPTLLGPTAPTRRPPCIRPPTRRTAPPWRSRRASARAPSSAASSLPISPRLLLLHPPPSLPAPT
mmetsp:Transcript_294/g.662  ORF Transcript_294/g.662 Transcript_294/m.662 type:complete len:205 (-) Transcript_294:1011-1625(-)